MKTNLKGTSGIKGLLLLHGEKIIIGIVGLLALWFIYSALGLPSLDSQYQASNLQQQISQTTSTVQNADWPSPDSEQATNVRIARPIEQSASLAVKSDSYVDPQSLAAGFRPVIPPTTLRTDPPLLNAVDVRATGGTGMFSFMDEAIRKAQELKQRALEQQRQREQEKFAQQQAQQAEQQARGGRRRGEAGAEFGMNEIIDPAHPNRRLIQGMTQPAGVPLQGGERIERAHWAIVVAKVPVREQLKLYQDAFEQARGYDPTNDFPMYMGYVVQRAEVVRGQSREWQDVPLYDAQRKSIQANKPIAKVVSESAIAKLQEVASTQWAGQAVEPVDPRYLDPVLTLPLPPLVGRDFGADATHPDIPLAINAPPMEEEQDVLAQQQPEAARPESDDPFRRDPLQQPLQRSGGFGAPFMREGGRFSRGGGEFGGPPMRGYPNYMGEGRGMMPSREMYGGAGMGMGSQPGALPRGVDFFLLRFIDYTVQPGKKYKYRVRLAIRDPNYGVDERVLDPAVVDRLRANKREARLIEEWSDPSPTVGIPVEGSVYLAEVRQPREGSFNDEPAAKLYVEKFDIDPKENTAVRVAKESEFRRGYVVNLEEKNVRYTGDGDRWIDTYDSYKIYTNVTVLDVYGGQRINRDYTAPARMLAMDAAGELSIRKELDDSTDVEYLRMLFTEDKRRGAEQEMMMGPGMPFGEGMMPRGRPGR